MKVSLKKHIPNAVTSMNLLCGVVGVTVALRGGLQEAFILMVAAAVFDFCDGLAARLLRAYSDIGRELDSLADCVSFGVLPSVMMYAVMEEGGNGLPLSLLPLLLAVFSALRLAKFNIDERQHRSFLGLPTPASAMICGSLCSFVSASPQAGLAAWAHGPVLLPLLTVALSSLLVSEIPMFSMKFGRDGKENPITQFKRIGFVSVSVCLAVVVAVTGQDWALAVLSAFVAYVVMNMAFAAIPAMREKG